MLSLYHTFTVFARASGLLKGLLLWLNNSISGFSNPLEDCLALQIEQNGCLFDLTAFEDTLDDLVAMKRLASFA